MASLIKPTTITIMHNNLLPLEFPSTEKIRPMTAIGMISQYIHPNNGKNAMAATNAAKMETRRARNFMYKDLYD
jgi:hypothetical protein